VNVVTDIASYNAKIMVDLRNAFSKYGGRTHQIVEMQVGQVQNTVIVEGSRQIWMRHGQLCCFKLKCPCCTPLE
jgi:hypothetical protein